MTGSFVDYLELTKPRLTLLVLASSFLGFFMASPSRLSVAGEGAFGLSLLNTLFAAAFIGGGINTLNQYMERSIDAKMKRTENRPIPSGRITPLNALIFGIILTLLGIVYLFVATNVLAGTLGVLTAVTYVFFYTPLKQRTRLNTLIGAIPGALPCIMGWAARENALPVGAISLFMILFFWQLPHFFAIAWVYKKDYDESGLKMLTLHDSDGSATGKKIIFTSILLFGVTLIPVLVGLGRQIYASAAIISGVIFISYAFFINRHKLQEAKKFVTLSIYYLLVLIAAMAIDKML